MPRELIAIPSYVNPASYVYVDNQRFPAWLATQANYPAQGASRVVEYLARNIGGGADGDTYVKDFMDELKAKLTAFISAYVQANLGYQMQAGIISNIISRMGRPSVAHLDPLRGKTTQQRTAQLSAAKKLNIQANVETWAENVRKECITWWVDQVHTAGWQAPALAAHNDANVAQAAGVACAVHTHNGNAWAQVGNRYNAALHAGVGNHAEMQWKDAATGGVALAATVNAVQRVDFHISEQPCAGHCARELVIWWRGLATATPAYIVTYNDTDHRAHLYRLMDEGIFLVT